MEYRAIGNKSRCCPLCGAPSQVREGVTLTPVMARIFDIVRVGTIETAALTERLGINGRNLRQQIFLLNNRLAETDWRVKATGPGMHNTGYQLIKSVEQKVTSR